MTSRRHFLLLGPTAIAARALMSGPGSKAIGNPAAPLKIDVFSDFECPSCKTLHEATLPALRREFVDPGKVYLTHRDFPLPQHKYARLAAAYATAAAQLGRYDQVANALFQKQQYWAQNGKIDEVVSGVLTESDMKRVQRALTTPQVAASIEADIALGRQIRLTQTPTTLITKGARKTPVAGYVSVDVLRRYLNELLKA